MAHPGRLDELNRKFEENPRRYFAPLANEYRKAGELGRAIELCRSYLPHQPAHMSGYIVYGQSLFDAGRGNEASEIFHQALNLDPENLIALRHLGDIARANGDKTAAMQWYQRVLELDPKNEEITAFITALAVPGTFAPPPPKPPAVRPEPTPDPEAVALADLMEQPDAPQSPIEVAATFTYREESEQMFEVVHPDEIAEPDALVVTESDPTAIAEQAVAHPVVEVEPVTKEIRTMERSIYDEEEEEDIPLASPFVTETMAALYLQQGFTKDALEVYRKLAAVRDEPRLHEKVRELEVRLVDEEAERAVPASVTGNGETVREFFVRIGARRPTVAHAAVPRAAVGLGALFGTAQVDARDAQAAASLASAFADSR